MIAAVVVGYFPDFKILDNLLLKLLDQVNYLVFVDNSGGENYLLNHPVERSKVEYVNLNGNEGLGYALNEGFKLAIAKGCEYVATFDQDSAPPDLMIAALHKAHIELKAKGINCAAVAPIFYDHREGKKIKFPFYQEINGAIQSVPKNSNEQGLVEVDVLITSGMLVNATAWSQGVHYDAGLFVDYTDTDWAFRARAAGFKLFADLSQEMGHAPSDAPPARLFGLSFFRYSPLRRYYYYRNTVFFIRQNYVSRAWKIRLTKGLLVRFVVNLFIDERKMASLKMMVYGILDGFDSKTGICKRK